jgi:hypothetical protein
VSWTIRVTLRDEDRVTFYQLVTGINVRIYHFVALHARMEQGQEDTRLE